MLLPASKRGSGNALKLDRSIRRSKRCGKFLKHCVHLSLLCLGLDPLFPQGSPFKTAESPLFVVLARKRRGRGNVTRRGEVLAEHSLLLTMPRRGR